MYLVILGSAPDYEEKYSTAFSCDMIMLFSLFIVGLSFLKLGELPYVRKFNFISFQPETYGVVLYGMVQYDNDTACNFLTRYSCHFGGYNIS